jgi:hypothetical protein
MHAARGRRPMRPKAVTGFTVAKPEPQLDGSGSPAQARTSAAVAIAATAKPATWLPRFRFGGPLGQQTASHRLRTVKNRSRADISACISGAMCLQRDYRAGKPLLMGWSGRALAYCARVSWYSAQLLIGRSSVFVEVKAGLGMHRVTISIRPDPVSARSARGTMTLGNC